MRQLVQSRRTGELLLAEVPVPACGRVCALVRTRSSVVSAGTERQSLEFADKTLLGKALARPDLVRKVVAAARREGVRPAAEKAAARLDQTVGLGYSAAGEVVEVGAEADGLIPGDRVAVAGAGWANHAEFNAVPVNLCAKLPTEVSYADGAFATVGAIALQGVRRAEPMIGENVVVLGLGLIGLLTVQILKAGGCAVLGVDPDRDRATLATKVGADAVAPGGSDADRECSALTGGRGADAVIIAAATPSNQPIESAARMLRPKGRIVVVGLVGMDVPREIFYRKELDLRLSTSYGPGRYDPAYEERNLDYPFSHVRFTAQRNMESFLYLVKKKSVAPELLVTHRLPFDDALDAYAMLRGQEPARELASIPHVGILLEYPSDTTPERLVRTDSVGRRSRSANGDELRVGAIGAGAFARGVLLPRLVRLAGVRLVGVCTTSAVTAHDAARRFRCALATTDPAQLFDDPEVDAVVIATRHSSHAALAATAMRAGKHVFVEKPLCLSGADLIEVERALDDARQVGHNPCLMVGFNRRFARHTRAVLEAFAERAAPMVVNYRVSAGRVLAGSWLTDPAEGGRIIGEACHFVDLCNVLVGATPVEVTAHGTGSGGRGAAEQSVVLAIRYDDDSLATIQYVTTGSSRLPKERCEVFAEERTAVLDDFCVTRFLGVGRTVRGRQDKGFSEELSAFLDACRGGPWPISWESMAVAHHVCFSAVRSLETGRPVRVAASISD